MFKIFAHLFAIWLAKLKHWHAVWYDSTVIDTLVRDEKLARSHVNYAGMQARWRVNHVGTQALWHVDYVDTKARIARHLANSAHIIFAVYDPLHYFPAFIQSVWENLVWRSSKQVQKYLKRWQLFKSNWVDFT